jgi:hypothetical protein
MRISYALVCTLLLAITAGAAQAQTRSTPCDPATPSNAICVVIPPVVTNIDGTANTKATTYRVTRQFGSGTFTTLTATATDKYYDKGLPDGPYTYVVYANCTPSCTESGPSNATSRTAVTPPTQPNPPVIQVVQVTISSGHAPVYRVIGSNGSPARGEMFGLVPVGRECVGPVLFRYRGKAFRLVHVEPTELWGTADSTRLAAPCA